MWSHTCRSLPSSPNVAWRFLDSRILRWFSGRSMNGLIQTSTDVPIHMAHTVQRPRENTCGGMAALVLCRGNVYYQWTRGLLLVGSMTRQRVTLAHTNGKVGQLRVACSNWNFTVCCGCSDNIMDRIRGDLKMSSLRKHMKAYCLLFVHSWNRCFQDGL
jgi:hypothetical protein